MDEYKTIFDGHPQIFGTDIEISGVSEEKWIERMLIEKAELFIRTIEEIGKQGFFLGYINRDHYQKRFCGFEIKLLGVEVRKDPTGKPITKKYLLEQKLKNKEKEIEELKQQLKEKNNE